MVLTSEIVFISLLMYLLLFHTPNVPTVALKTKKVIFKLGSMQLKKRSVFDLVVERRTVMPNMHFFSGLETKRMDLLHVYTCLKIACAHTYIIIIYFKLDI